MRPTFDDLSTSLRKIHNQLDLKEMCLHLAGADRGVAYSLPVSLSLVQSRERAKGTLALIRLACQKSKKRLGFEVNFFFLFSRHLIAYQKGTNNPVVIWRIAGRNSNALIWSVSR